MTVLNIGSINWDRVYRVTRFPSPGETLSAGESFVEPGGKGLNQSVALQRSGAEVRHLGAIGADDAAMRSAVLGLGLCTDQLLEVTEATTGSAILYVDPHGENTIVLDRGANGRIPEEVVEQEIGRLGPDDWVLLQNETNILDRAVTVACRAGVRVAVAAAPFEADRLLPLLGEIDLLAVNEVEERQLREALGKPLPATMSLLVTRGGAGASFLSEDRRLDVPARAVHALDTSGAGDTVLGAFLARLSLGDAVEQALDYSMAAASLQVSRRGTSVAIPTTDEVRRLLAEA